MNKVENKKQTVDLPIFLISGGLLLLFVIMGFINQTIVTDIVNTAFAFSSKYFGGLYQVLLLGTFFMALVLGFSKYGHIKLGDMEKPEIGTFEWISIIMTTLLAAGGVFWAAAEPLSHFINTPPHFEGIESGSKEAINPALATSFVDWGFLAWAVLGTLATIVLMHAHYHKGAPLKPRTLLYPFFGERILKRSVLGTLVDSFCIISVAAGTIGPIGFLGLQASYGLSALTNLPDTLFIQMVIIVLLVIGAAISAATGIHRGIQYLSSFNVLLALFLIVVVLLIGPALFIFDSYINSFAIYVENFFTLSAYVEMRYG